jgi:uncharacterized membrane protein
VALYGVVLLCCGIAYYILTRALLARQGKDSPLHRALGRDMKEKLSVVLYALAVGLAFLQHWLAIAIYVAVAIIWLIPDTRVERTLAETKHANST